MKKRLIMVLSPRYIFADLAYLLCGPIKSCIDKDMKRFLKWDDIDCNQIIKLNMLLKQYPFRNVFYYRMKNIKGLAKIFYLLSRVILLKCKTIEISGEIGPGLLVSHNFSVIRPGQAGNNLRVGPGVVIGRNGNFWPQIGDNVYIASNSTVIGDVKIGDNVIIGAGSVVVKDIPDNSVAVGNPARVIRTLKEDDLNNIM